MTLLSATLVKLAAATVAAAVFSVDVSRFADEAATPKQSQSLYMVIPARQFVCGVIMVEDGDSVTLDGHIAPSGTTIFSDQAATTRDRSAVIYVEQFNVNIHIAPQTTVRLRFSDKGISFECECDRNLRVEVLQGSLRTSFITITKPFPKTLTPLGDKWMEEPGHVAGSTEGNINFSVTCKSPGVPQKSEPNTRRRLSVLTTLLVAAGAIIGGGVAGSSGPEKPSSPIR